MAPISIEDVCNVINNYVHDKKRPKEIHINAGKIMSIRELIHLAKSILKNFKFVISNNNRKDSLKIYKTKKYFIKKNIDCLLRSFFKKNV